MEEAIAGSVTVHEVFATEDDLAAERLCASVGLQVVTVTAEVLGSLASSVKPRGPVAVIATPPSRKLERADSIVMWDVSDPGNAGTIVRTAAALGFQVVVTTGSVDVWSPKVVRSGVGGHFRVCLVTDFDGGAGGLIDAGMRPFVAAAGTADPADTSMGGADPIAIIVGNEAHGVPAEIAEAPDVDLVALAMPGGTDSLNASVAAGILMYLRMLQR